ncbi:hypothetical protein CEXT_588171 [Caerostris extrusa]|uniref:Uncharacterized protein n=1 Tax=Caerostris extrusa TaxID=172846 RepID=A0AAV4WPU4_CAEEX|nr:hypothetical protein CEXT_588171 [Caerostris extrusa]
MTSGRRDALGHSCSLQEISKSVPLPTVLFAAEYLMPVLESPVQKLHLVVPIHSLGSSWTTSWAGGRTEYLMSVWESPSKNLILLFLPLVEFFSDGTGLGRRKEWALLFYVALKSSTLFVTFVKLRED